MIIEQCPECKSKDGFKHLHNTAHGVPETHISGTERYECKACGKSYYKDEGEKHGFGFDLDK